MTEIVFEFKGCLIFKLYFKNLHSFFWTLRSLWWSNIGFDFKGTGPPKSSSCSVSTLNQS